MSSKVVTLYSKPNCVQCETTVRWFKKHDIEYIKASAIDSVEPIRSLLNLAQAPIVKVVDEKTKEITFWSGFNPIMLAKHLLV